VIDWDQWRADYHRLSFADQVLFYREAAAAYPEQASYDWAVVDGVLGSLDPGSVLELGGWDGGLAGRALAEHPWISSWVNVDLADVPQVCDDQRYRRVLLDDWFWRRQWQADLFISCHTLEHMRTGEAARCVAAVRAEAYLLEVPLTLDDAPAYWPGFPGSHVIEDNWPGLDRALVERGLRFERGLGSRGWARLYVPSSLPAPGPERLVGRGPWG